MLQDQSNTISKLEYTDKNMYIDDTMGGLSNNQHASAMTQPVTRSGSACDNHPSNGHGHNTSIDYIGGSKLY